MSEENNSLREKLEKDADFSNWQMLHPNFVRDILFVVDGSIDFIDACMAAAQNNQELITSYIDKGLIGRPSGLDVEKWHKEKPLFRCLVVSPYVFVQLTDMDLQKKTDDALD